MTETAADMDLRLSKLAEDGVDPNASWLPRAAVADLSGAPDVPIPAGTMPWSATIEASTAKAPAPSLPLKAAWDEIAQVLASPTRAAVITRGLAEMSRLGTYLGGDPLTLSGLAGMGDLVATCISQQSRNRYVGEQIGRGRTIDEIIAEMSMVAEGVKTSKVVMELAREHGVSMPIAREVHRVVYEGGTAADAYRGLTARPDARAEMHGMPNS